MGAARAKRSFGAIRRLPSGRYQSFPGPDLQRHVAPTTFLTKDAAIVWLTRERRLIEAYAEDVNAHWLSPAAREEIARRGKQRET